MVLLKAQCMICKVRSGKTPKNLSYKYCISFHTLRNRKSNVVYVSRPINLIGGIARKTAKSWVVVLLAYTVKEIKPSIPPI